MASPLFDSIVNTLKILPYEWATESGDERMM